MTFITNWLHEPYIMATTFTGMVAVTEVDTVMLEYLGALQETEDLYFLLDFARSASVPTTLLRLSSISQVVNHGNTRWFAVVNPVGFDQLTTRLLVRDKVKVFDTREKGLGFLRGMVRLDKGEILDA